MNFSLELDSTDGENVFFKDITISPDYSIVKQTRFLCGNYIDEQAPMTLTEGDTLDIYRQYQKTSIGDSVYDNKTIPSGGFFIPFVSGLTVLSGDEFVTTGIYSQYVAPGTFLPTTAQNVFIMNTGYWGFTDSVFPDRVYDLQYETYEDTTPETLATVTNEVQYIVYGTGSSTAVYDGNTYRVGEVFIAVDNGAVSFTGDAVLKQLIESKQKFYTFIFGINYTFGQYIVNQDCCGSCYQPILCMILLEREGLILANYNQWVSARKSTETIDWITNQLAILENCAH